MHREASAAALAAAAILPVVADVTRPETLRGLPAAETLLYCVGYREGAGPSRWTVYVDGLQAVLDAAGPDVRRVVLISSTGVYAEHEGGWVDENSPCGPVSESGRALLAAEQVLAAHRLGDRGIVLRLAGIYGPRRLPGTVPIFAAQSTQPPDNGRSAKMGLSPSAVRDPLAVPAGHCINLIHVDDAAAAVLAAEARAIPPRTYNIADGHPADRREFLAETALQLGMPSPAFHDALPGKAASRRGGNKRVSNRRMLEELRVTLVYPTFLDGLKQLHATERTLPST